jgi:hypothetical protein
MILKEVRYGYLEKKWNFSLLHSVQKIVVPCLQYGEAYRHAVFLTGVLFF